MILSPQRQRLLEWTRSAGARHWDPRTGLCLIERDTAWFAASLLASEDPSERARGNSLLRSLNCDDGTHTPASFLVILHALREALDPATAEHLTGKIGDVLVHAAETVHRDGNVNHPLGAYATLILGGELCDRPWALALGFRRLVEFQRRIGDHRSRLRRQAEMAEYNSLTYTPLTLCFLAAVASYARDEESRALALFLEKRLWINVAMHFHPPSQQFAGPHSRSYAEDSLGGFSALHCAMMAAFECDLFVDPNLPDRFAHPSNFFQNVLSAVLPFHVPEEARRIAFQKPYPYLVRLTTYAESYHENSRRHDAAPKQKLLGLMQGTAIADRGIDAQEPFAFDDEVYHGGWSELSTYIDSGFTLGSSTLPYVNAGHADSVMVRIARHSPVGSLSDFRSGFTRGSFNGLQPGDRAVSHSSGTLLDGSFFIEEGRSACYQHRNRVIVCYAPKRTGHLGLSEYRTDFVWGYHAPFDYLAIDGRVVPGFPCTVPPGSAITIRDGNTLGILIPLGPRPSARENPVQIRQTGELLLVSCWNYRGESLNCSRDELTAWHSGFYLELHPQTAFPHMSDFLSYAAGITIDEQTEHACRRQVTVRSGEGTMEMTYDPFRELILSRSWNGKEEGVVHFEVEAGPSQADFSGPNLYGSELLP